MDLSDTHLRWPNHLLQSPPPPRPAPSQMPGVTTVLMHLLCYLLFPKGLSKRWDLGALHKA